MKYIMTIVTHKNFHDGGTEVIVGLIYRLIGTTRRGTSRRQLMVYRIVNCQDDGMNIVGKVGKQ